MGATADARLAMRGETAGKKSSSVKPRRNAYGNEVRPAPDDIAQADIDVDRIRLINKAGEIYTLAEIELKIIRFAIRFYEGKMTKVARRLGIGRSTLYRKLAQLDELDSSPDS